MRGMVASIAARSAGSRGGGDGGVSTRAALAALSSALPMESGDTAGICAGEASGMAACTRAWGSLSDALLAAVPAILDVDAARTARRQLRVKP